MDTTLNFERRDSGEPLRWEEREKKHCKKPSPKPSQQQLTNPIHSQKPAPSLSPKKKITKPKHQFNPSDRLKSFHPHNKKIHQPNPLKHPSLKHCPLSHQFQPTKYSPGPIREPEKQCHQRPNIEQSRPLIGPTSSQRFLFLCERFTITYHRTSY